MKHIKYITVILILAVLYSCQPQKDKFGSLGNPPTSGEIKIDNSDPYNPVFSAVSEGGFIYLWNLGNGQTATGQKVTSYYPFAGDYGISCKISGTGGEGITTTKTFTVDNNDPKVANMPVWKELTGAGAGTTWVYNTDPATGSPDYCYQTGNQAELDNWDGNGWQPSWSWGQCVQITPDINGEMVFDLIGGINYTYHHVEGDAGVHGTFILNTENMTLTVKNPYILDYNIDCTNPATTINGVYEIKLITEDQLILWQDQLDSEETGWGWSFKKKGTNPDIP